MKTIIEPFRIKMVEPIRMTTVAERERILAAASTGTATCHGRAHQRAPRRPPEKSARSAKLAKWKAERRFSE